MLHGHTTVLENKMFPSLTGIAVKGFYGLLAGGLAFVGGELLVKSGLLAGIIALVATVTVEGLRTIVALRRERINERKTRIDEFQIIEQQAEILHAREKRFLENQITYFEALEKANRERAHAMLAELQRCNGHIRICAEIGRTQAVEIPTFKIKSFEEIVAAYPLPDPPITQAR